MYINMFTSSTEHMHKHCFLFVGDVHTNQFLPQISAYRVCVYISTKCVYTYIHFVLIYTHTVFFIIVLTLITVEEKVNTFFRRYFVVSCPSFFCSALINCSCSSFVISVDCAMKWQSRRTNF